MEDDTRRFQPASIVMSSIETGAERYTLDGHLNAPPMSPWRNNVTALSQRFNLYFVATKDIIAVFLPRFPFQKLGKTPSLVITPTLANKSARGYIDEACSHAINHLVVGDLGNHEILLVARDSGNVEAYYTRSVRDAIDKEPYRFNKERHSDFVGLRAFFSHWVHESAWGLAIHREARMIAVSGNTPHHVESADPSAKVTVFAFALVDSNIADGTNYDDSDDGDDVTESEWQDWTPPVSALKGALPSRDRNYKVVLGGCLASNIPSISFINSSEDREGKWLFSTDIDGDMFAWHIWANEMVNSWTMTRNEIGESALVMREDPTLIRGVARRTDGQTDRGWLVAALDPQAFAVADNMQEFCGAPAESGTQSQSEPESFSVTDIAGLLVPGNSQRHPQYRHLVAESDLDEESSDEELHEQSSDGSLFSAEDNVREVSSDHAESLDITPPLHPGTAGIAVAHPDHFEGAEDDHFEGAEDAHFEGAEGEDESISNDQDRDNFSQRSRSSSSTSSLNVLFSSSRDYSLGRFVQSVEEGEQDLLAHGGGVMVQSSDAIVDKTESFPSIPLLHCSASHLRIFNAPLAEKANWFCADLLTQLVPNQFTQTAQYAMERLNMVQQIPELGIVIIASQSGRCAVCSTMKRTRDGPYGLRVDWVLPTKKQEKAGLRPPHALLGIAVGPIQGMMREDNNDEPEDEETFEDRIINGTPTSFGTNVVVMDLSEDESRGSNDDDGSGQLESESPVLTSDIPLKVRQRPWWQSPTIESWRGPNYSRRYRLMLTYYEWTVLTYEITREEPYIKGDRSRKNYHNRPSTPMPYDEKRHRQKY